MMKVAPLVGCLRQAAFGFVALTLLCSACLTPCWAQVETIAEQSIIDEPTPNSASVTVPFDTIGEGSHIWLRHLVGDGVSHADTYSSIGVLRPLYNVASEDGDEIVSMLDMRFVVQNDLEIAGNLGWVHRRYFADTDRILGLNLFYDIDGTRHNSFQQAGAGLEMYGPQNDFLVNGYIPFGDKVRSYGHSPIYTGT